jgi:hypothetical protein
VARKDTVDPLDLFGGIKPVGPCDPHQKGRKGHPGIGLRQGFRGGAKKAAEDVDHGGHFVRSNVVETLSPALCDPFCPEG